MSVDLEHVADYLTDAAATLRRVSVNPTPEIERDLAHAIALVRTANDELAALVSDGR